MRYTQIHTCSHLVVCRDWLHNHLHQQIKQSIYTHRVQFMVEYSHIQLILSTHKLRKAIQVESIPVVSLGSLWRPAGAWPCNMFRNSFSALRQRGGIVCQTSWMIVNTPRTPRPTTWGKKEETFTNHHLLLEWGGSLHLPQASLPLRPSCLLPLHLHSRYHPPSLSPVVSCRSHRADSAAQSVWCERRWRRRKRLGKLWASSSPLGQAASAPVPSSASEEIHHITSHWQGSPIF